MYTKNHIETLKNAMDSTLKSTQILQRESASFAEIDIGVYLKNLESVMLAMCDADIKVSTVEKAAEEVDVSSELFDEILQRKMQNRKEATAHLMYLKFLEASKPLVEDHELSLRDEGPIIKCPISKTLMTMPMKNKQCGHSYDRAGVQDLLKYSKKGIRCPVAGCASRRFKLGDLEEDEELKKYIAELKRKK